MGKDIKISGGFSPFISNDETLLATFSRNAVYICSLETRKRLFKFKSLSNIDFIAISNKKEKVAVKNTSGVLALHDLETGEEMFRNSMAATEGEQIYFTSDDKFVLDIDWGGRFMIFDCNDGSCKLLDNKKLLPHCDFIRVDYINKIIYRFMRAEVGYSAGIIQSYHIDEDKLIPEFVNFETINKIKNKSLIDKWNISLCRDANYYYDGKEIVKTDKNFKILKKISIDNHKEIENIWVSDNENYIFVDYGFLRDIRKTPCSELKNTPYLSVLYDLKTMAAVKEFNYPYVSDFKMVNDEKEYIISTWSGTYIGEM